MQALYLRNAYFNAYARWLLEPRAGVFVGRIPAYATKLWEKACSDMAGGAGILIHNADNEQGFSVRFWGSTNPSVLAYED